MNHQNYPNFRLKRFKNRNQSMTIFDKHIKDIVQQQHDSHKRQEKNQERLLDHRYKLTCEDINDKVDTAMLDLNKYPDDALLKSAERAQNVISEALEDLLKNCRGNKDVYNTFRNISRSQFEIFNLTKSLHLRYKVVTDDFIKQKEAQFRKMKEAMTTSLPPPRDPKISTFEAMKQIDQSIQELLEDPTQKRKDGFTAKKFSGVDDKLNEVYRYLGMIKNDRIEASSLLSRSTNFDDVQGFVKNQAKALQLTSSRFLADKLAPIKPAMVTRGTQDNYGGMFLNEVDRLNIKVHEREKTIKIKETQLQEIREKYTLLSRDVNGNNIKMRNAVLKVEMLEKKLEEYRRQITLKSRIIGSYEDQISEITNST